jgi:hypothetical protein
MGFHGLGDGFVIMKLAWESWGVFALQFAY